MVGRHRSGQHLLDGLVLLGNGGDFGGQGGHRRRGVVAVDLGRAGDPDRDVRPGVRRIVADPYVRSDMAADRVGRG